MCEHCDARDSVEDIDGVWVCWCCSKIVQTSARQNARAGRGGEELTAGNAGCPGLRGRCLPPTAGRAVLDSEIE